MDKFSKAAWALRPKSPIGWIALAAVALAIAAGLAMSFIWTRDIDQAQLSAAQEPTIQCGPADCDAVAVRLQAREVVTTEATFELAQLQTIFNFFGLIGLAFTAFIAHRAWREAQRSATAAVTAYEAENRTWLTIQATGVTDVKTEAGIPSLHVILKTVNVGHQPAFEVRTYAKAFSVRGGGIAPSVLEGALAEAIEFANIPNLPGTTILAGAEQSNRWGIPSERSLESEAAIIRFSPIEASPILVSIVYCVTYRCIGATDWATSSGVMRVSVRGHLHFPENGQVPNNQLDCRIDPSLTRMT